MSMQWQVQVVCRIVDEEEADGFSVESTEVVFIDPTSVTCSFD